MAATTSIGFTAALETDFESALRRVVEALKAEGFGVLTEIDVRETMKSKLGADFRPYKILGACNPPLAHRALTAVPEVGLLLPCNVTVSQEGEALVNVSILDPFAMLGILKHPELEAVAQEARAKLERVIVSLQNT